MEVAFSAAILFIVAVGVLGALEYASTGTASASVRDKALNIASKQIELAREIPYDSVGVYYTNGTHGDPDGNILTPASVAASGAVTSFRVDTKVSWVRDPVSGHAKYKAMKVTVSWNRGMLNGSVSLATNIFGRSTIVNAGDILLTLRDFDYPNNPIPDAVVTLVPSTGSSRVVSTDSNGEAFFGQVPTGNATMTVQASGWLVQNAPLSDPGNWVGPVTVSPDAVSPITLFAQRPSQAIVTVLHTGTPMQGATVIITRRSDGSQYDGAQYTGTTVSNGQALFPNLWEGTYDATASASGGYQSMPGTFTIIAGNTTAQTTISLPGPATIIVRAVELDGTPIVGASVWVFALPGYIQPPGSPGVTGSDGTCSFSGLVSGGYYLAGWAAGHFTSQVTTNLAPDSVTTWTATLPKILPGNLKITVKNQDGTLAVKGVSLTVTCYYPSYTASPDPRTATSGPDIGTVTLTNLQWGYYYVTPSTPLVADPPTVSGMLNSGSTTDMTVTLTTNNN